MLFPVLVSWALHGSTEKMRTSQPGGVTARVQGWQAEEQARPLAVC